MTRPSWVALHSMAHSFMELDKAEVNNLLSILIPKCDLDHLQGDKPVVKNKSLDFWQEGLIGKDACSLEEKLWQT